MSIAGERASAGISSSAASIAARLCRPARYPVSTSSDTRHYSCAVLAAASFQTILLSGSVAVGIVGGLVAASVSAREYQLEARTQRAEIEIQLARLFSELVPIANARGPATLSEAAVQAIAGANPGFTSDDLLRAAVPVPVGLATQAAAVASIGYLGSKYESPAGTVGGVSGLGGVGRGRRGRASRAR